MCIGAPIPLSLTYRDSDENQKIDTLEIIYDQEMTGSIDLVDLFLSSATGGLYERRIHTETGFFLSGSLSRNMLTLTMVE